MVSVIIVKEPRSSTITSTCERVFEKRRRYRTASDEKENNMYVYRHTDEKKRQGKYIIRIDRETEM